MADPISILGLVGTATQLIGIVAKTTKDLYSITIKYKDAPRALSSIQRECTILNAALSQLKSWIRNSLAQADDRAERIGPLQEALVCLRPSLTELQEEVDNILSKTRADGKLKGREKFKIIWNDDMIQARLNEVRWQSQHLHLLLSTTTLPAAELKNVSREASIHTSTITRERRKKGAKSITSSIAEFKKEHDGSTLSSITPSIVSERSDEDSDDDIDDDIEGDFEKQPEKQLESQDLARDLDLILDGLKMDRSALQESNLASRLIALPLIDLKQRISDTFISSEDHIELIDNLESLVLFEEETPDMSKLLVKTLSAKADIAMSEKNYASAVKTLQAAWNNIKGPTSAIENEKIRSQIAFKLAIAYGELELFQEFDQILEPFNDTNPNLVQDFQIYYLRKLVKDATYHRDQSKDYISAEESLQFAIQRIQYIKDMDQEKFDKNDLFLELAYTCLCQDKLNEADQAISTLSGGDATIQIKSLLSIIRYLQRQLDESAELLMSCIQWRLGRLQAYSDTSQIRYLRLSVRLLASTCRRKNDNESAIGWEETVETRIKPYETNQTSSKPLPPFPPPPRTMTTTLTVTPPPVLLPEFPELPLEEPNVFYARSRVNDIIFSPNGKLIASALEAGEIMIWALDTGEVYGRFIDPDNSPVQKLAFSPDGSQLISTSSSGSLKLWDVNTGNFDVLLRKTATYSVRPLFSPNGHFIMTVSSRETIQLYFLDSRGKRRLREIGGHKKSINRIAFSPDNKLIASSADDWTVGLWDPTNGKSNNILKGHTGPVNDVTFSPDGRVMASSSEDKTVRLWRSRTGALWNILKGHSSGIIGITFSPDGQSVASVSRQGTVRLWDLGTGETKYRYEAMVYSFGPKKVVFSPNSELMAFTTNRSTITLWNSATGEEHCSLDDHSDLVGAVIFSIDGRLVATSSVRDGTIKLWPNVPRLTERHLLD